jgi:hypothetical protein
MQLEQVKARTVRPNAHRDVRGHLANARVCESFHELTRTSAQAIDFDPLKLGQISEFFVMDVFFFRHVEHRRQHLPPDLAIFQSFLDAQTRKYRAQRQGIDRTLRWALA